MYTAKNVLKNSGYLLIGRILSKVISFFILLQIARYLGPEDYGIFSFAFAFVYFFSFLPDLGIHNILVREYSKNHSNAEVLIGNVTIVKIILSLLAFIFAIIIISFLNVPLITKYALYTASSGLLFMAFSAYGAVYEVNMRMDYSVFFSIVSRISFFVLVLIAIYYDLSLVSVVFASVFADLIHNFLMFKFSTNFVRASYKINMGLIKKTLKESIPIALSSVFIMIYFRIDVLMLSFFKSDFDVGLYSASYRLTEALIFISSTFLISIFPLLSRYYGESMSLFVYVYSKSLKYLFAIGVIISLIITFFAEDIVLLIYGIEFIQSTTSLQLLVWATTFMFINKLLSLTFISVGSQKVSAKITALAAFINIVLNYFWIPSFGHMGASLSTLLTEFFVVVFSMYWLRVNIFDKFFIKELSHSLFGGFMMVITFICFDQYLNDLYLLLCSLLIFVVSFCLSGGVDSSDKDTIHKLVRNS